MSFVHLHVHSQYSLLQATSRIDSLVKKCTKYQMPAVALTDYGNLFGALEFYFECKKHDIQPIIGLEVYLTEDRLEKVKKVTHSSSETLVLLVQNQIGYQNLCRLSTIGYQEGFYYIPRIDKSVLKKYNEGLIALTGAHLGKVFKDYQRIGEEKSFEEIKNLNNLFQDRLYLELTHLQPENFQSFLKDTSGRLNIPLVATNNVHYVEKNDHLIQDVLICIGNNETLEHKQQLNPSPKNLDFKSPEEMKTLFPNDQKALDCTLEIAKQCHLEFLLKDKKGNMIYHLPTPRLEKRKNLESELKYLSEKGLNALFKNESLSDQQTLTYKERLKKELNIIQSMGFTGYFLIVHEFVHWAKEREIPVGPGRGSGASSLVAYCLGITDIDPMKQNLLFERFLNPERISMPDFDIDFCQEHRNEVIQHVHDTYGEDFVAQVITFGRLQAKAAIRDVGRVLAMSYSEVDVIAKLIPEKIGITIQESIEQNPTLKELKENDSQIATLIDLAMRIEGLVRHVSIHAAGVIIADQPMVQYAPLYRSPEGDNVIQYDLKYAKKIGLVKFDFLGLKTLTYIQGALDLIEKNRKKKIKSRDISISDSGIYELMNQGDTLGVFQFEGFGITDLIQKAKPQCFEDIIAINALFRPGPMDMIPSYLDRRESKTAEYVFSELEPVLKETHGIVVYQEQVLLISALIAGYSFGEADVLRRAMSEKISSEMNKQKKRFLEGAKKNNYDLKKAEQLFDTVAEFAKYGFNKAHATAYCVLAAQTAWLKHYYPVEFFASLLSTEMADAKKVTKYIKNAKERGIYIHSPHINDSQYSFSVKGDVIYFALGAIKGVGKAAVDNIVEVRESLKDRKFLNLDHFLESVDSQKVNKKTMDSLVKAGAFDRMGYEREEMIANFDKLVERAEKKKIDAITGQSNLFDFAGEEPFTYLSQHEPWSSLEKLNFEKSVIGFYLSEHPLDYFKCYMSSLPSQKIQNLKRKNSESIKVWGVIDQLKETVTRNNKLMAFAQLEDDTGYLNLIFFSKLYLEIGQLLKTQEPIYIEGRMGKDESRCIVDKVIPFNVFLSERKKIEIKIPPSVKDESLKGLKEIMEQNKGSTSVVLKLDCDNVSLSLLPKTPDGVHLNLTMLEKIRKIVSTRNIRLI